MMLSGFAARRRAAAWKPGRCRVTAAAATAPSSSADTVLRSNLMRWVDRFPGPLPTKELKQVKLDQTQELANSLLAICFFRERFYRGYREIHGQLHDLALLLYVGALCKQQQQQLDLDARIMPLAERVRNGSLVDAVIWLRGDLAIRDQVQALTSSELFQKPDKDMSLAFKGDPDVSYHPAEPLSFRPCEFKDLTVDEIASLIHVLHQPESLLAKLMAPDPLLTHYENLHTAIEHSRLFLLKAQLPICIGLDITYGDLASHVTECDFPGCRKQRMTKLTLSAARLKSAKKRLNGPFPSRAEAALRKATVYSHHVAPEENWRRVEHETPNGCPEDAHRLVRRVLKLRRPFLMCDRVRDWKDVSYALVSGELDGTAEEMEAGMVVRVFGGERLSHGVVAR